MTQGGKVETAWLRHLQRILLPTGDMLVMLWFTGP